jgi:hypothetical protein
MFTFHVIDAVFLETSINKIFFQVLICAVATCVSSAPLEAGYGVPLAPVVSLSHHLVRVPPLLPEPAALPPVVHSLPTTVSFSLPAAPTAFAAPAPAAFIPTPVAPAAALAVAAPPSSQFHAQDEFGQFSFGYQNINSAHVESKDAFGVTHGSYQYVDANGVLQTVHYVADPVNGFRVAGTNIPVAAANPAVALPVAPLPVQETPEVAAARAEHLAAVEAAKNAATSTEDRRKREADPITGDYEVPLAPVIVQSLPTAQALSVLPISHPVQHVPVVHTSPAVHSFPAGHSVAIPSSLPVFSSPLLAQAHAAAPFLPAASVIQPARFSHILQSVPCPG